jgi:AraC-like DNA-binding protein
VSVNDRGDVDDTEVVEAWRTSDDDRVLWMRGVTTTYRVDPVGEYVIGVASGRGYRLRRGRTGRVVRPGQLVVLDPTAPHSGSPAERGPWVGHLVVIELAAVWSALLDEDHPMFDVVFPDPVIEDARLTQRFLALHQDAARGASALERQAALQTILIDIAAASPTARPLTSSTARDDPAVRRAVEYLNDGITRNVSLDELSGAAGMSKFRLVRQFKDAIGVPPHKFQVALRVNLARRLLERGERPTDVAAMAGFTDQSHLHRHFRDRLGMTPAQYARATTHVAHAQGEGEGEPPPRRPQRLG